tara:strand:+ start:720 stop:1409 length:690 start_codon:yes stop_codon:yes gene_type:complete
MKNFNKQKKGVLLIIIILMCLYFGTFLQKYITLENIKLSQEIFISFYQKKPNLFLLIYFMTYVIITSFSLPGATILTLAGGAFFGIIKGTLIVSFASSIGATFAMLISRYLIKDWVQYKFKKEMEKINFNFDKDGVYYLFSLRLLPLIPFFVVNLLMGLTSLRIRTFFWVSQLGMLPATLVYINAGLQINNLNSISDIYSIKFIISFLIFASFPFLVKKVIPSIEKIKF